MHFHEQKTDTKLDIIWHFKQNIFFNFLTSIPELIILHVLSDKFTSGIEDAMPELPSKSGRNWSSILEVNSFPLLLPGIDFWNWGPIPTSFRK